MKTDKIIHYLNEDGMRLTICTLSNIIDEWKQIHSLSPLWLGILGQMAAGAAVLATDFKNKEGISLIWNTNSSHGRIHIDAYDGAFLRGYIDNPNDDFLHNEDTEKRIVSQNGVLSMTRYSLLRTPYTSMIHVKSGSVSDGLNQYLQESEQILSQLETKAEERRAAACLAQLLPGGKEDRFRSLFQKRKSTKKFSNWEHGWEKIIKEEGFREIYRTSMQLGCTCGEERFQNSLVGLPKSVKASLLEDPKIEIACPYCKRIYIFSRETLDSWFKEAEDG